MLLMGRIKMPKGGHARTGPARDPKSRTSERRCFSVTALPAAGYDGQRPDLADFLPEANARHATVWMQLWATPQACVWSNEPWRWATVADLARCIIRAQDPESPAAWSTPVRQLRDDLGLSEAGLRFHGWAIAPLTIESPESTEAPDELAPKCERRLREPARQADAE